MQNDSAAKRSGNLRQADGAVEQTEVSTHIAAGERIGEQREWQCQHCSPSAANEQERNEQHVLVVNEQCADESRCAKQKADDVRCLERFEARNHHCPNHRAHGLNGKEHAHPVLGDVACGVFAGDGPVDVFGDGTMGVGPHIEECSPAEELHQTDGPECRRRFSKQLDEAFAFLGFSFSLFDAMIFGIFFRRIFFYLGGGVDYTQNQYCRAGIEAEDDRVGHHASRGSVFHTEVGEHVREQETHQRAGVAKERLDAVGFGFLLLVDHVAHHHLEWLHGNVDAGVEEHEREQPENHGSR